MALLFCGLSGYSNKQVAEQLLASGLEWAKGCVYLDDKSQRMVLLRGQEQPVPLASCGLGPDERFTFYDQVHTTGIDVQQVLNATAAITLGKDMTFRDLKQGAWRMRGVGKGQTLKIVVVDEVFSLINSTCPHGQELTLQTASTSTSQADQTSLVELQANEPQQKVLAAVIRWLVVGSINGEEKQRLQLLKQELAHCWRKRAFELLTTSDSPEQQLASRFAQDKWDPVASDHAATVGTVSWFEDFVLRYWIVHDLLTDAGPGPRDPDAKPLRIPPPPAGVFAQFAELFDFEDASVSSRIGAVNEASLAEPRQRPAILAACVEVFEEHVDMNMPGTVPTRTSFDQHVAQMLHDHVLFLADPGVSAPAYIVANRIKATTSGHGVPRSVQPTVKSAVSRALENAEELEHDAEMVQEHEHEQERETEVERQGHTVASRDPAGVVAWSWKALLVPHAWALADASEGAVDGTGAQAPFRLPVDVVLNRLRDVQAEVLDEQSALAQLRSLRLPFADNLLVSKNHTAVASSPNRPKRWKDIMVFVEVQTHAPHATKESKFVALSLAEAAALRRAFHSVVAQRHNNHCVVSTGGNLVTLTLWLSGARTSLDQIQFPVNLFDSSDPGEAASSQIVTARAASVTAACAAFNFFDANLRYAAADIPVLLKMLADASPADRRRFFEDSQRARRRDRVDWQGTAVSDVFVYNDPIEWHELRKVASDLATAFITVHGSLQRAFHEMDSDTDGLVSRHDLQNALLRLLMVAQGGQPPVSRDRAVVAADATLAQLPGSPPPMLRRSSSTVDALQVVLGSYTPERIQSFLHDALRHAGAQDALDEGHFNALFVVQQPKLAGLQVTHNDVNTPAANALSRRTTTAATPQERTSGGREGLDDAPSALTEFEALAASARADAAANAQRHQTLLKQQRLFAGHVSVAEVAHIGELSILGGGGAEILEQALIRSYHWSEAGSSVYTPTGSALSGGIPKAEPSIIVPRGMSLRTGVWKYELVIARSGSGSAGFVVLPSLGCADVRLYGIQYKETADGEGVLEIVEGNHIIQWLHMQLWRGDVLTFQVDTNTGSITVAINDTILLPRLRDDEASSKHAARQLIVPSELLSAGVAPCVMLQPCVTDASSTAAPGVPWHVRFLSNSPMAQARGVARSVSGQWTHEWSRARLVEVVIRQARSSAGQWQAASGDAGIQITEPPAPENAASTPVSAAADDGDTEMTPALAEDGAITNNDDDDEDSMKLTSIATTNYGFPSVIVAGVALTTGRWYYECTITDPGIGQVGWASMNFVGASDAGTGVGDDKTSWAYDGQRCRGWHNGCIKWYETALSCFLRLGEYALSCS